MATPTGSTLDPLATDSCATHWTTPWSGSRPAGWRAGGPAPRSSPTVWTRGSRGAGRADLSRVLPGRAGRPEARPGRVPRSSRPWPAAWSGSWGSTAPSTTTPCIRGRPPTLGPPGGRRRDRAVSPAARAGARRPGAGLPGRAERPGRSPGGTEGRVEALGRGRRAGAGAAPPRGRGPRPGQTGDGGLHLIAMPFLGGATLGALLERGPWRFGARLARWEASGAELPAEGTRRRRARRWPGMSAPEAA